MKNTADKDIQGRDAPGKEPKRESFDPGHKETTRTSSGILKEISYMILFIAAVFVVNAMETGSYRTPWPVAIITGVLGIGLYCYSWYLQFRTRK